MTEDEVQVPEEQTEETSERWFVAPKTLAEMPTKPASDTVTFDAQSDDDNELFLFSFPYNVCPSHTFLQCRGVCTLQGRAQNNESKEKQSQGFTLQALPHSCHSSHLQCSLHARTRTSLHLMTWFWGGVHSLT